MAVWIRSVQRYSYTTIPGDISFTVPLPTNVVGDVLVAFVYANPQLLFTPAGWNVAVADENSPYFFYVFWKVSSGGETSFTIGNDGANTYLYATTVSLGGVSGSSQVGGATASFSTANAIVFVPALLSAPAGTSTVTGSRLWYTFSTTTLTEGVDTLFPPSGSTAWGSDVDGIPFTYALAIQSGLGSGAVSAADGSLWTQASAYGEFHTAQVFIAEGPVNGVPPLFDAAIFDSNIFDVGVTTVTASTTVTLDALTVSSTATLQNNGVTGSLTKTLDSVTSSASATLAISANSTPILAPLSSSATGAISIAADSAPTLASLTLLSSGAVVSPIIGTADQILGSLTSSSGAVIRISGDSTTTLGGLTSSSDGTISIAAQAAATLGAVTSVGSVYIGPTVNNVPTGASGTTSAVIAVSGATGTDEVILIVMMKPTNADGSGVTYTGPNTSWTLLSDTIDGGYTGTSTADIGNMRMLLYRKTAPAEASVTVSATGVSPIFGGILRVTNIVNALDIQVDIQSDITGGVVNATFAPNVAVSTGESIAVIMAIPTDVTTPTQFTTGPHTLSYTGGSSTITRRSEFDFTTGNDAGAFIGLSRVSTFGIVDEVPSITLTPTGTATNVRGPIAFLRFREQNRAASSVTLDELLISATISRPILLTFSGYGV